MNAKLSTKQRYALAMFASGANYQQIGTVLRYERPYGTAANLIAQCRYKLNCANLSTEEFKVWLTQHGWPQCPYCGEPARMEDKHVTPIHLSGPAEGSFICHLEGDPECDCWACLESKYPTS